MYKKQNNRLTHRLSASYTAYSRHPSATDTPYLSATNVAEFFLHQQSNQGYDNQFRASIDFTVARPALNPSIYIPTDGAIPLPEYKHIVIGVGEKQLKTSRAYINFFFNTSALLKTLNSKPSGRFLLNEINNSQHSFTIGNHQAKVVIVFNKKGGYQDNIYQTTDDEARDGLGINSQPGTGSVSLVSYSHLKSSNRLSGNKRPPYITLAHELIHALRLQKGLSSPFYTGIDDIDHWKIADKSLSDLYEELEVIGLKKGPLDNNGKQLPTENSIRTEHGLPLRMTYGDITMRVLRFELKKLTRSNYPVYLLGLKE